MRVLEVVEAIEKEKGMLGNVYYASFWSERYRERPGEMIPRSDVLNAFETLCAYAQAVSIDSVVVRSTLMTIDGLSYGWTLVLLWLVLSLWIDTAAKRRMREYYVRMWSGPLQCKGHEAER